jgi:phage baseplate assembly protein gpV
MIVIGQVSTADPASCSVRVTFPDRDNLVSAPLPVLMPGGWARGNTVPEPGETVLCVYLDRSYSAGFCLGTYYGSKETAPGNINQHGVWFEDGSFVFYDRSTGLLTVKATGGVSIEGDLTVTGSVTSSGGVL